MIMWLANFDRIFVRPEKKNISLRDQFALQKMNEKVSPFRLLVNDQWSYKKRWGLAALLVGCWLQPPSYFYFLMSLLAPLGRWAFVCVFSEYYSPQKLRKWNILRGVCPKTYFPLVSHPSRWSFFFTLGPLQWSTSRERRNIVQLCTNFPWMWNPIFPFWYWL